MKGKHRRWTAERIAQAYRDQGVPWCEDVIEEKAARVAREMLRMDIRWHHKQRKFYRNEIPCGLLNREEAYSHLEALKRHERLRREDWEGGQRRGCAGKPANTKGVEPGPCPPQGAAHLGRSTEKAEDAQPIQ